jgi:hypothetical protein
VQDVSEQMYDEIFRTHELVCVLITAVPIIKLFARRRGIVEDVLRETTSRSLCGLVCPSRTSERGGEGDCVKEGGGGEGERERERALGRLLCHIPSSFGTMTCTHLQ